MSTRNVWTSQELPDSADLQQIPELGPVALLQAALVVARTALETATGALTLRETVQSMPGCDVALLARLAANRCDELGDLLACYRIAIAESRAANDDDHIF